MLWRVAVVFFVGCLTDQNTGSLVASRLMPTSYDPIDQVRNIERVVNGVCRVALRHIFPVQSFGFVQLIRLCPSRKPEWMDKWMDKSPCLIGRTNGPCTNRTLACRLCPSVGSLP